MYKICDIQEISGMKGIFQKRELWVEIPTTRSMAQRTEIYKFETIFEEVTMLDEYTEGKWVDIVFTITGRKWKDPNTSEEKVFNSLKLINLQEGPNPFD